jgi:hypothetical protein
MASSIPGSRTLAIASRGLKNDTTAAFRAVSDTIGGMLIREAGGPDLPIPDSRKNQVTKAAGDVLIRMFVGLENAPFGQDGVTAQAPYPALLNKWYVYVIVQTVRYHRDWMKRTVPADVFAWLSRKPVTIVREIENPFLRGAEETIEAHKARLAELRIFKPNPLAEYEAMHTWVDPNEYRLSDRIWNTADATRNNLHRLLRDGINQGMSAARLAKLVEQYLLPGRAMLRTRKPYGRDGSQDAMRLARTEIARAANQAAYISAQMNPYVSGIDICRSGAGDPLCPVCPQHASIDMGGGRVRDPYPMGDAPIPPFHPHDMCNVRPAVTDSPATVTQQLRAIMQEAQQDLYQVVTPANAQPFILELVGRSLMGLVAQVAA